MSIKSSVTKLIRVIFKDVLYTFMLGLLDSLRGAVTVFYYNTPCPADDEPCPKDLNEKKGRSKKYVKSRDSSVKKDVKEFNVQNEVRKYLLRNVLACFLSISGFTIFSWSLQYVVGSIFADNTAGIIFYYSELIFSTLFNLFWFLPLYLIFKIVNTFWCQDIANYVYRQLGGRTQIPKLANHISDIIISSIIVCILFIYVFLLSLFLEMICPLIIARSIIYCQSSLLYSLCCFEYVWCNLSWPLPRRINYVERNWPYFLGFGLPLTFLVYSTTAVLASGFLFMIGFPFFIISALLAHPLQYENSGVSLPIFSPLEKLISVVTAKLMGGVNQRTSTS